MMKEKEYDRSMVSVLISVYEKERPQFLGHALSSIEQQTILPDEIVLVKDGSLTPDLDNVINYHSASSKIPYKIIELKENVGLAEALNEGMEYCNYGWVARMDSDDIALPDRFEKQFAYLAKNPDIDILGSWICEFDDDPDICDKERRVPEVHDEIVRFSQYRCPLNHMTVVFRKDAVLDAGGYQSMHGPEDYYLWMRMLLKGKRFANVPQILVKARTGIGMISRRQGWEYAKNELILEKTAYQIGFWSAADLARNFFTRFLPRLLPVFIVEKLYNLLRKF